MALPAPPGPRAGMDSDWDRDAALVTARILLEIKAVNFRPEQPYILTSGWASPVYIDCRRIIYFPRARLEESWPGGGLSGPPAAGGVGPASGRLLARLVPLG